VFISKINVPAASGELTSEPGCVVFWSFRDTTASAGSVFELWDGSGVGARYVASLSTTPGQSTRDWIKHHDLPFVNGLYYSLVSGAVVGQVTVALGHRCDEWWERPLVLVEPNVIDVSLAAP